MTTGADLVVLAVDSRGRVRLERQLGFALAAAELVDLASARRIEVVDDHIHVTERLRTGDPVLDETLARLGSNPKGHALRDWIAMQAPDRVAVHVAALLESGSLTGRLVATRMDAPPEPFGLRPAGPDRRAELVEKLTDIARHEVELEDDAFGALAHAADVPGQVLPGLANFRTRQRLRQLAQWFTDTYRYLPGCPEELTLGDADLKAGEVNPAYDEPWRLAVRLAVQEAVKRAEAQTRKSQSDNGLSNDVSNAALLAYAVEHRL